MSPSSGRGALKGLRPFNPLFPLCISGVLLVLAPSSVLPHSDRNVTFEPRPLISDSAPVDRPFLLSVSDTTADSQVRDNLKPSSDSLNFPPTHYETTRAKRDLVFRGGQSEAHALVANGDPDANSLATTVETAIDTEEDENEVGEKTEVAFDWATAFPKGSTCRTQIRKSHDMSPLVFVLNTCAYCYKYVPNESAMFGSPSKKFLGNGRVELEPGVWVVALQAANGSMVMANVSDPENLLYATFANPDARAKWVDCCRAAERCCKKIAKVPPTLFKPTTTVKAPANLASTTSLFSALVDQSASSSGGVSTSKCPGNWDGWQCWEDAEPESTSEVSCPHYIFFKSEPPSCLTHVPKVCDSDGQWRKTNVSGFLQDWTNYTACANAVVEVQKKRVHVHIMAYAVSIIALTPAIIVFFYYKQLRVQRTILHQNLFISMFINAIFVILFKTVVILNELEGDRTIINQNGVGCRLLFILTKYLRMTNYMWMFCEGYYLHKLFAAAFAEQNSLIVFYLLGWAFPVIPTGIYAGLRLYGANDRCWVVPEEVYEWVLNFPSMLSLLINLGFLCNILRVIWTKIKTTHQQYRKALRAVLLLLPLFGLHFVVTIYRPPSSSGCAWIELYYYVNYVLDGLQGWLVALNFCYVNSEVLALIKRSYTLWKEQREVGMQRSHSRINHRPAGGGAGGHTTVSSYYSSVPDSPEPKILAFSSDDPTKVKTCLTNGGKLNVVGTMLLTSIQEDTSKPGGEGWSEITLNVNNANDVELKEAFNLSPINTTATSTTSKKGTTTTTVPVIVNSGASSGKNGVLLEHQL